MSANPAAPEDTPELSTPPADKKYKLTYDRQEQRWELSPPDSSEPDGKDLYPFTEVLDKISAGPTGEQPESIDLACKNLDAKSLNAFMFHLKDQGAPCFENLFVRYDEQEQQENVEEITACPARAVHVSCSTVKALKADFADEIYLENCPKITDITCSQNTTIHFLADQHVPAILDFSNVHVPGIALEINTSAAVNVRDIIPPPKGITIQVIPTEKGRQFIQSLSPEQKQYFQLAELPTVATRQSAELTGSDQAEKAPSNK